MEEIINLKTNLYKYDEFFGFEIKTDNNKWNKWHVNISTEDLKYYIENIYKYKFIVNSIEISYLVTKTIKIKIYDAAIFVYDDEGEKYKIKTDKIDNKKMLCIYKYSTNKLTYINDDNIINKYYKILQDDINEYVNKLNELYFRTIPIWFIELVINSHISEYCKLIDNTIDLWNKVNIPDIYMQALKEKGETEEEIIKWWAKMILQYEINKLYFGDCTM